MYENLVEQHSKRELVHVHQYSAIVRVSEVLRTQPGLISVWLMSGAHK